MLSFGMCLCLGPCSSETFTSFGGPNRCGYNYVDVVDEDILRPEEWSLKKINKKASLEVMREEKATSNAIRSRKTRR